MSAENRQLLGHQRKKKKKKTLTDEYKLIKVHPCESSAHSFFVCAGNSEVWHVEVAVINTLIA